MASVHHANTKTTARIRKEIQDSEESIAVLAKRLSLDRLKDSGRLISLAN